MNQHILSFDSFMNENVLNESKNFGDMTDAIGGGDEASFKKFFSTAKKGDTFEYAPNGVELDYIKKSDMNKDAINLNTTMVGRDSTPKKCTVEMVKNVVLLGGSFEYDRNYGPQDAIFFNMQGDNNTYVLTDPF